MALRTLQSAAPPPQNRRALQGAPILLGTWETVPTHDFLNAFGSQFPCSLYIFQRLAGSFRFLFYINQRVKKWFRIRV